MSCLGPLRLLVSVCESRRRWNKETVLFFLRNGNLYAIFLRVVTASPSFGRLHVYVEGRKVLTRPMEGAQLILLLLLLLLWLLFLDLLPSFLPLCFLPLLCRSFPWYSSWFVEACVFRRLTFQGVRLCAPTTCCCCCCCCCFNYTIPSSMFLVQYHHLGVIK